jgi:tetratricopeptide (TPR) repeat protein
MKVFKFLKIIAWFSLLIGQSSCKTNNELGGGIFASSLGNRVVRFSAAKDPLISPYQRPQWIDLKTKSKEGDHQRMIAMLSLGEDLDAEREARKSLLRKPGDLEVFKVLAVSLALSSQYQLAAYYADIILAKDSKNSLALNLKGIAKAAEATTVKDFQEAEKYFLAALNSDSKEVAAGLNLGQLYLDVSRTGPAFEVFKKTSQRCSRCQAAVLGFGVAASRSGKKQEALSAFQEVLKVTENHVEAKYHLAMLYKNNFRNNRLAKSHLDDIIKTPALRREDDVRRRATFQVSMLEGKMDKREVYSEPGYLLDPSAETILTGGEAD